MDRTKLAELRQNKAEKTLARHKELVDTNISIKDALIGLHELINGKEAYDDSLIIEQFKELQANSVLKADVEKLERAIRETTTVEIQDFQQLLKLVENIRNDDVVKAVNELAINLQEQSSQQAKDYQPVRRVRKVGTKFVFDDEPLQVSIASGGGSSVQSSLIRNGNSIAVVNSNGSSIGGLIPNQDFDYIDIQQTSATVETYVYKQGGTSGTTVQTITVTYTDSTKNDLDKVEYA